MNNSMSIVKLEYPFEFDEFHQILKQSIFSVKYPFLKNINDLFLKDLCQIIICFYNTCYLCKNNGITIGFIIGNIPRTYKNKNYSKIITLTKSILKIVLSNYKLKPTQYIQIFKQLFCYTFESIINFPLFIKFQFSANISLFHIENSYQRQGVGLLLYTKFEQEVIDKEKETLYVKTQSNLYYQFYLKNEFYNISVRQLFWTTHNLLVLKKMLLPKKHCA